MAERVVIIASLQDELSKGLTAIQAQVQRTAAATRAAGSSASAGFSRLGAAITASQAKAVAFGNAYSKALDNRTTTKIDMAGAGLVAAFGASVWAAAGFEKQMSAVGAVSNASAADMQRLSDAALKAGADTAFSASQAAAAEAELVKAGISTADVLGGGLKGALDLAAAGGLDLAQSAGIAASAMNQFGLAGADVPMIADALASGANKSAADVAGLGQALNQVGLVANQTGLSLTETVGALSAFADSGMQGSDAGTSLKTMLMSLTPTSKQAADTMAALGLSAYDQQGAFVGLADYAGQLQTALGGLSAEQQTSALKAMFGADAYRAAAVLMEEGKAGVDGYTKAMEDQGAAADMAGKMMDNLAGDLEELKGSLETLLITGGEGAQGPFRSLVQGATEAVNAVGRLPGPLQAVGFAVTGLAGAFLLLGPRVAAAKAAMSTLGVGTGGRVVGGLRQAATAVTLLGGEWQAAGQKARGAGGGVAALGRQMTGFAGSVRTTASLVGGGLKTSMSGLIGLMGGPWGVAIAGAVAGLGYLADQAAQSQARVDALRESLSATGDLGEGGLKKIAETLLTDIAPEDWDGMRQYGITIEGATAALAQGGAALDAYRSKLSTIAATKADGGGIFAAFTGSDKGSINTLLNNMAGLASETDRARAANDAAAKAAAVASGGYAGMVPKVTAAAQSLLTFGRSAGMAADEARNLYEISAGGAWLDQQSAVMSYQEALDAAGKAAKDGAKTLNVHTAAGRENRSALLSIASAARAAYTAKAEDGTVTVTNAGKYRKAAVAAYAQARAMGATAVEAARLTRKAFGAGAAVEAFGKAKGKARVSADITDLEGKLKKAQARLDALKGKPQTTKVKADTAEAQAKVDAVKRKLRILKGTDADPTIDADNNGALTAIGSVKAALNGLPEQKYIDIWIRTHGEIPKSGDTASPHGRGTGKAGRTLTRHAGIAAALGGGYRVTNVFTGGGGLGFGSGDHQAGRAVDVQGPRLGAYVQAVRAMGGFAELHGTGPGRHAHAVLGDTASPRRAATADAGDTGSPHGRGVGSLAATMARHAELAGALGGGYKVTNLLVGGGGKGYGSGDHQAGRAVDVQGPRLGAYVQAVRAMGGFAELHGTGRGRHAHAVMGDTASPRRAATADAGDTGSPRGRGVGSLAATMARHAELAGALGGGYKVTNLLVGGGGKGYGSGDHQAGRAVDVQGPRLGAYVQAVRAAGGFAELHGTGGGRHAHAVLGDTASPRRAATSGGGGDQVQVGPFYFTGVTGQDQRAIRRTVEAGIREYLQQRKERGV